MCESLDIRNGFVAFTDGLQLAGDTANYGCIPGFTLVGNTNRVCRENGTWTGSDPSCESNSDNKRSITSLTLPLFCSDSGCVSES